MAFLTEAELKKIGFKSFGRNVKISSKTSIYNPGQISIGDNVRIDDFCVLSAGEGGIQIGSHIHIAVFCSLIGHDAIVLRNFSNLSARVGVLSSSDDFSGDYLIGPCIPDRYRGVVNGAVEVGEQVIVGAGSVILPGARLNRGVAIGALSLVQGEVPEFSIAVGIPCRVVKERKRGLEDFELSFLDEYSVQ